MTRIELGRDDDLILHVLGVDRILAFKSELRIPLAHISRVGLASDELYGWKGWRAPGISIPGLLSVGTFFGRGGKAFYDIRSGKNAIAIHLRNDDYTKIIVDVDDPEETVETIQAALTQLRKKSA